MKRECGTCIACCVYWRVRILDKPPMVPCSLLNVIQPKQKDTVFFTGIDERGGCSVYETRLCPKYTCAWLDGYGEEEDRPDKVLMMFDDKNCVTNAYLARPLKPGQETVVEGVEVINRMLKSIKKPIVVLNFYERQIVRVVGEPIGGEDK